MLTVVIPVYNQVDLCRQCLISLTKQTYRDFEVIIIDDGSDEDYLALISEFPGLRIRYIKNEQRLGAIKNIFNSIFYPVTTPYIICLHQDDVLHPEYLNCTVAAIEKNSSAAFVGSNGIFFSRETELTEYFAKAVTPDASSCGVEEFTRFLLNGNPFMLASVLYRTTALKSAVQPDLERFSVACDRPFLIELAGQSGCVVLGNAIFYSRRHGIKDTRGKDVRPENIFNLYDYYRSKLPIELSETDKKLFFKSATNNLLLAYRTLSKNGRPSAPSYIWEGQKHGLIKFNYLDRKGLFGLLSMLIGYTASYYLLRSIQNI